MSEHTGPIGVFDSGVGGISVLRELYKELPNEDFHFYGDSQNAPYGTKPVTQVRRLAEEKIGELVEQGAKAVVIACNTATSAAEKILREKYPKVPIIGMEPAVKPAVLACQGQRILVLATPVTITLDKFVKLQQKFEHQATILCHPCPGLAELIEQGDPKSQEIRQYLHKEMEEYRENPVQAVVLGCTHYPFIKEELREALGSQVRFFDGAQGTARQLRRRLTEEGLLSDAKEPGKIRFDSSLPGEEQRRLYEKLFQMPVEEERE